SEGLTLAGASMVRALELGFGSEFSRFVSKVNAAFGILSKTFSGLGNASGSAFAGFIPEPILEVGSALSSLGKELDKAMGSLDDVSKAFFEAESAAAKFGSGG